MIQRGERPRFAVESGEAVGIVCERGGQHLDRDRAPRLRIGGPIHLTHAAGADLAAAGS
jgi:hypothetical protein